jgi:hypothetical protein
MIAIEGLSRLLYDLAGDPEEAHPSQNRKRIDELSQVLEAHMELSSSRQSGFVKRKISLNDELIQQRMRDLGYIE